MILTLQNLQNTSRPETRNARCPLRQSGEGRHDPGFFLQSMFRADLLRNSSGTASGTHLHPRGQRGQTGLRGYVCRFFVLEFQAERSSRLCLSGTCFCIARSRMWKSGPV